MWTVLVFVILDFALASSSSCQRCLCPPERPKCPAGVSIVQDGCGCCKVCAGQLNEDCSRTEPCDHIKGLECNFGGQYGADKGICRASSDGQTCEYSKKIYQNGEIFQPDCKQQCSCLDGAVGCVSLCPPELHLPKERCLHPRVVKVPGQCCEQLVCPGEMKKIKKYRRKQRLSDDFVAGEKNLATMWTESLSGVRTYALENTASFDCAPQTSDWSSCSRSCGTGVSTRRAISRESRCKMVTETRICEIRPCDQIKVQKLKSGQKCQQMQTPSRPARLSLEGCRSVRRLPARFCGSCVDGRCCRPQRTHTEPVLFTCKGGKIVSRLVMKIQSCKCDFYCSDSHKTALQYHVFNDVHKLRH
ncbi:CCN family member 1-like [Eucyclogobius newberryi]|uniref:CCN family member 1-like n=1 Tax=Eucyclogobius newberryi TaxID=166745 RepID=UPI003B5CAC5A